MRKLMGPRNALSWELNLQQRSEFLDGTKVGLGRLLFLVRGVLPVEAERGGCLPSEPLEVLLLGLQNLLIVPVVAEQDDPASSLFNWGIGASPSEVTLFSIQLRRSKRR